MRVGGTAFNDSSVEFFIVLVSTHGKRTRIQAPAKPAPTTHAPAHVQSQQQPHTRPFPNRHTNCRLVKIKRREVEMFSYQAVIGWGLLPVFCYIFSKNTASLRGVPRIRTGTTQRSDFLPWSSSVFYFSANNLQPWQKQAEVSDDEAHTVTGLW